MKKLLLLLSVCIMTLNVSAQDIFNEVKKMKDNAEALMNDKTKDLETRKIACFKYDVLYYLLEKLQRRTLLQNTNWECKPMR